jgi:hypothetical protein
MEETVTCMDEAKISGYFETIKSNFFIKLLMMTLNFDNNKKFRLSIPKDANEILGSSFKEFDLFLKALTRGNMEILDNLQDDLINNLIIDSWVCFELIIKDITKKDYALNVSDISVDYRAARLGLSQSDKDNLDLFYYIRNAYVHYNGAYYTSKDINKTYESCHFVSKGHEGEKINIPNLKIAYKIHLDIEQYAYKAWGNYQKYLVKR